MASKKKASKKKAKARSTMPHTAEEEAEDRIEDVASDVRVKDFSSGFADHPHLQAVFQEMERQWPGKSRIGTVYVYFQRAELTDGGLEATPGSLHIHFVERGSELQRAGALADIPSLPPGVLLHGDHGSAAELRSAVEAVLAAIDSHEVTHCEDIRYMLAAALADGHE
jgi:hypothetical protein